MRRLLTLSLALAALLAGGAAKVVQDQCGPFTDVTPALCPYILELYYLGITAGTSATTYSPDDPLTRGQAAVFVAKGLDQSLARSSRRAALGQWWTTESQSLLGGTPVGPCGSSVVSDGTDLWVVDNQSCGGGHLGAGLGVVYRIRASDGRLLETWSATNALNVLIAAGRVFVTGSGGNLYVLDPSEPPGAATVVATVGSFPFRLAFDGGRLWVLNTGESISIVTPSAATPWPVTTVQAGRNIGDIVFDGKSIWATDVTAGTLLRLDSSGEISQTVAVGPQPRSVMFDGANLWVSVMGQSISIVQATTGLVVGTLTGSGPFAFDGVRVLAPNSGLQSVSLWRAADLAPLGTFPIAGFPISACSDGQHFWLTMEAQPGGFNELVRF